MTPIVIGMEINATYWCLGLGLGLGLGRPTFSGIVLEAVAQSPGGTLSPAVGAAVTGGLQRVDWTARAVRAETPGGFASQHASIPDCVGIQ